VAPKRRVKRKVNLWTLVRAYAASQVAMSWLGATHPDDHDEIIEYNKQIKRLMKKVCGKKKVRV
jgi:hypothetical protein